MRKKLFCLILCTAIVLSALPFSSNAVTSSSPNSTDLDNLDVLLSVYRTLSIPDDEGEVFLDSITRITRIIPLYDINDSVIAYYVEFAPSGYAVVNNNINNPVLLEFSTAQYTEFLEILSESESSQDGNSDDHICYGGASNFFFLSDLQAYANNISTLSADTDTTFEQLSQLYAYMSNTNNTACNNHSAMRNYVESSSGYNRSTRTSYTLSELKEMFGIYDSLPATNLSYSNAIMEATRVTYGTTGEFGSIEGVEDHCAATAAFNLILFEAFFLDCPSLIINDNRETTFRMIHSHIGNGPVLFATYNAGLSRYVQAMGKTYHYSVGTGYSSIKSGINSNHMSTVLLCGNLINWHMVLAFGYREYTDGTKYIRIIDGWETNTVRFIAAENISTHYETWIT